MAVTTLEAAEAKSLPRHDRLGVRARLLLAFFAIAAFAVLAAAAGMYAFREVGSRLEVIDTRVPPTLSALELSRSAERIIAAAPALLSASGRAQRDEVKAELAAEVGRLNATLARLKRDSAGLPLLSEVERTVSSLAANLAALDELVARRLVINERIGLLRSRVFQIEGETQRLLAPWLEVVGRESAMLVEAGKGDPTSQAGGPERLSFLIELQRLMRTAQARASAAADMLIEASTTNEPARLPVLEFQLGLAFDDLAEISKQFDPRLRPLFLEEIAKLRGLAQGDEAIAQARSEELMLVEQGEDLLAETARLSSQLGAAIDRLGDAAKADIGMAIQDALLVQRQSASALVLLVALSLLTSVLIVWLYVGKNIVRRLTALSDGMLAIIRGRLETPVVAEGSDEIAAMARAVEVFRQNTLERDKLLSEKARAADLLEQEVRQRTAELETANTFKSRFLAAASHDLRQPLHALNLFIAQLRNEADPVERARLVGRIDVAVGSVNELLEALLDMSKLEAGVLEPEFTEFPVNHLFKRIETTFVDAACEKGLRLIIVPSHAWVRSDFVLLERVLFNLVSNAVRCTSRGGVLIGGRFRSGQLRIDVCDTGPGIPADQQQAVFGEFYRLAKGDSSAGLGLGLAIVDRLGRLLDHRVELSSRLNRGSRFSVSVPLAARQHGLIEASVTDVISDPAAGKLVVVIDDDPLVLEGMGGILRSWGCRVVAAPSGTAALSQLAIDRHRPDLIVADYRLADGRTGIQAIRHLREGYGAAIPAFLISGDTAPERLRDAREEGYQLLHKPVTPMRLRAMLNQLLRAGNATTMVH
nr:MULTISPECIES: ATP-binding protein [Chelativorans]